MNLKISSLSTLKVSSSKESTRDKESGNNKKGRQEKKREKDPHNGLPKHSESLRNQLALKKGNQKLNFLEKTEGKLNEVQISLKELSQTLFKDPFEKTLTFDSPTFKAVNLTLFELLETVREIKKEGNIFMDQEFFPFGDWIHILNKCEDLIPTKNIIFKRKQIDSVETIEMLQKVQALLFPLIRDLNKKKQSIKTLLNSLISNDTSQDSLSKLMVFFKGDERKTWSNLMEIHPNTKPIKSIE